MLYVTKDGGITRAKELVVTYYVDKTNKFVLNWLPAVDVVKYTLSPDRTQVREFTYMNHDFENVVLVDVNLEEVLPLIDNAFEKSDAEKLLKGRTVIKKTNDYCKISLQIV